MSKTSNQGDMLTSSLRVATFSIALFDIIQTIPAEIQLYRKQIRNRRLSLVCLLFIILRYMSIVSLALNGVGFYSTHFNLESCRKFRLAPPITKMIAGMACQSIIFLRTWAISRKSRVVLVLLSISFVICFPFLVVGNVYKRAPFVKNGSCIAKQIPGTFNSAPMYYAAMSAFDLIACAIATYHLLDFNSQSMSRFTNRVLKHGLMYAFATTFANIIVLLALCHVKYIEKLGAFFSVAITMIMAQHLVLSTQNFNDNTSTTYSSSRDPIGNRVIPPSKAFTQSSEPGKTAIPSVVVHGSGRRGRGFGSDTFELGVRVQTETHMDRGDVGTRTVELSKIESNSSAELSGKGVTPDPERGYGHYNPDAKPL